MSKLFGGGKPSPAESVPEPEPVAPIPDDEMTRVNQERAYQRRYGRKGRAGTVLSMGNTLG